MKPYTKRPSSIGHRARLPPGRRPARRRLRPRCRRDQRVAAPATVCGADGRQIDTAFLLRLGPLHQHAAARRAGGCDASAASRQCHPAFRVDNSTGHRARQRPARYPARRSCGCAAAASGCPPVLRRRTRDAQRTRPAQAASPGRRRRRHPEAGFLESASTTRSKASSPLAAAARSSGSRLRPCRSNCSAERSGRFTVPAKTISSQPASLRRRMPCRSRPWRLRRRRTRRPVAASANPFRPGRTRARPVARACSASLRGRSPPPAMMPRRAVGHQACPGRQSAALLAGLDEIDDHHDFRRAGVVLRDVGQPVVEMSLAMKQLAIDGAQRR